MNNYWNTNFVSSQEGIVSFQYELTPFVKFSEKKEANELGQKKSKHPCLIYPVADGLTNKTMTFLELKAENVSVERLTIDLEKNSDILLLLKKLLKKKHLMLP